MRIAIGWFVGSLALGVSAPAQTPAPRATASVSIGAKSVSIEYGRPALKGRKFEELIKQLPADRMWRAGSEQVTTLKTEADLMIGGKRIPAGKYSLYVHCPESGDYALAVNTVLGQPLGQIWAEAPANLAKEPWPHFEYAKEIGDKEVARIPMKKAASTGTDLFTIELVANAQGATMKMAWGDRAWTLDIAAAH